ncbi:MAG: hypothetical protein RLZZ196_3496 [Bacteroidota bacterium]|jgi:hypothetical protein
MKIVELTKRNLSVYINNEEAEFLKEFNEENPVWLKRELDDRRQIIANQLVNKDLLKRIKHEGRIAYKKTAR